jgi:glycosyltransferase involved in cell wall biosynthesis
MFNAHPERDLAGRLYGIDTSQSTVVGLGMDTFVVDPGAFERKHGLRAPYVIYSGRREPLKGTPLLLDYLCAFRARTGLDVKLVMTGAGTVPVPAALARHVMDLGFVSEADKHEAMAGATAFCHPSVNESFGIVLLESWLAGTPALVHHGSDVLRYQCQRSNGGLWFRHYPDFEEALSLLVGNQAINRALANAGREFVLKTYTWDAVEERMFRALDA